MWKNKSKYDWYKIKLEFFKSDFIEIAPFIQQKYSKDTAKNSNIANNTKWWADEKKDFLNNIQNKVIEMYKPDYKEWERVLQKVEIAQIKWLEIISDYILKQWDIIKKEELWPDWDIIIKNYIQPFLKHNEIIEILNFIKESKKLNNNENNNKMSAKEWLKNIKEKII